MVVDISYPGLLLSLSFVLLTGASLLILQLNLHRDISWFFRLTRWRSGKEHAPGKHKVVHTEGKLAPPGGAFLTLATKLPRTDRFFLALPGQNSGQDRLTRTLDFPPNSPFL